VPHSSEQLMKARDELEIQLNDVRNPLYGSKQKKIACKIHIMK